MTHSTKPKHRNNPIGLLVVGFVMLAGGVSMSFIERPTAVFHQSYRFSPSTIEILDSHSGRFYGYFFGGCGVFLVLLYIRVLQLIRNDERENSSVEPGSRPNRRAPDVW